MKLMTAIAFFVVATSAFANDASVFVGRYKTLNSRGCDLEEGTRVYVSLAKKKEGKVSALRVQSYKEDASFTEISTVNSRKQTVTRDVSFTEVTTVKWISDSIVRVHTKTEGTSYGRLISYIDEYVVAKDGNKLLITFRSTQDGRNSDCEMTQY